MSAPRVCSECLEPGARPGQGVCDPCQQRLRDAQTFDKGFRGGWAAACDFFDIRLEDWAAPSDNDWRRV